MGEKWPKKSGGKLTREIARSKVHVNVWETSVSIRPDQDQSDVVRLPLMMQQIPHPKD